MKQKFLCKTLSIISACALLISTFGIFGSIFAVSLNKADNLNLQGILENSGFSVDNTTEKSNIDTALEKLTLPEGYEIGTVADFYKMKAMTGAYEKGSANGGSSYKGAPKEDTVLVEGIDGYISATVPVSLNGEPLGNTVLTLKIEAPMKSYSFKSCTNDINDWVGNNAEGWKLLQTAVSEKIVVPDEITKLKENWLNWNDKPICVVYGTGITNIPRTDSLSSVEVVSFKGNVTSLSGLAFYNWQSLKYIRLPEAVKNIGSLAFKHCKSIEYLYLPEGLETVGIELFYSPREDNHNHDPNGQNNNIGELNYDWAYKLSELTIPASVKDIYAEAFVGAGVDCKITVLTHSDAWAYNIFYHTDMDDSMGKHIYLRAFGDDSMYTSVYSLNEKEKLDDTMTIAEVAARAAWQAGIEGDKLYNDSDTVKKAASKMLLNIKNSYGNASKYTAAWGGQWTEEDNHCVNTVVINDGTTTATVNVRIPLNADIGNEGELKISNDTTAASLKKDLEAKHQGSSVEVTDFYLIESMPMVYEIGSTYTGAVDGEILVEGKNGYVSAIYTVTDSEGKKTEYSILETIKPEKIEKSYASVSNDITHWNGDNSSGYSFNVAYKAQKVVIPDSIKKLASDYLNYENAIECLVVGTGVTTLPRSPFQTVIDTVSFKSQENLKTIGAYAFHTWSNLKYIQLPDSVETISQQAFRCCTSLKYFYIPKNIKTIQGNIFYVPSEDNNNGKLNYSKGYNISNITVPATIESIYDYAFVGAASDCKITFLTKSDGWSWTMCYNNEWDKSLGEHIFIRGFAEDASYCWNHSVNEKVNLTESMTVCEAATRAAQAIEKVSGDVCESTDDAKSKEDTIKNELVKAYGSLSGITAKWKSGEWTLDGFIVKNSLVLIRNSKSVEIPITMYLDGKYELQDVAKQSGVTVTNSTNSVTLLEDLQKIVLPGGFKAAKITDFYKIDAIEGAVEIGSTYKGAIDGEILVPGEPGYIAAVVVSENSKGTTRKDAILLTIEPNMAEYSFETVSSEKDFTYNSANWGQRWEYHPMSGTCAEKIVIPDKVKELKADWHQNYIYKDFSSTVRCIVYNENIVSLPGVYNFSALQVVSFKGDLVSLDSYRGGNTYNGSFEDCRSLRHIRLPDTLKYIGPEAFVGCVSLKYLYLPEGLETIGTGAFWANDDWTDYYITDFTIPSTVKTIGERAFVGANLSTTITVLTKAPASNTNGIHSEAFYSEDRVSASNKNTVRVIDGSGASTASVTTAEGKKLFIKDSMSYAEAAARAAQKIAKIGGIEATVDDIESSISAAYGDASGFSAEWQNRVWAENGDMSENYWTMSSDGATFKIKLSAKLKYSDIQKKIDSITLDCTNSTDSKKFADELNKKLPGGYYVNKIVQYYKVNSKAAVKDVSDGADETLVEGNIGAVAAILEVIRADGKIETVYIQQKISPETVGYTFASVSSKNDFLINDGVLVKYSGNAEKIVIPEGVKTLSDTWLSGIEAKKTDYSKQDSTIRCIVYPESLEGTVPAQPRLTKLEVVSFRGDKVTVLGEEAFYKATALEYIQLPDGLKTIEKKALATGHRTCSSAVVLNITLPNKLEKIADYAFYWDDSNARNDALQVIEEIVIPESVTSIGEYAFAKPNVLGSSNEPLRKAFTITILNKNLNYSNGMLATASSNKADIIVRAFSNSGVYKALDGIGDYELINLDDMTITEAVARAIVKADNFAKSEHPSDITPQQVENEIIKAYGSSRKFDYSWNNSWDTSTDAKRYGTLSFSDKKYTMGIKVALNVPPIYTLDDLVSAVEEILSEAEFSNSYTESIYKDYIENRIPGKYKVQILDYNMQRAIDGAEDNTEVLVSGKRGSIAAVVRVTDYYGNFKDILAESVVAPKLEKYSFDSVSKREDFILSDDGTVLLEYYGTAEKLVVPDGVVRIANNWMWKNPSNIKALVLPESLKIIPSNLCDGMISLEVVSMKDNVISVGSNAFAYCYSLKYIHISDNIEEISSGMFTNTYSLMDIRIPETVIKIGVNAFRGSSVRNITVPETVLQIGENAFSKLLKNASDIGTDNFSINDKVRKTVSQWVEKNNISDTPVTITFMGNDTKLAVSDATLIKQEETSDYLPDYFASKEGICPKYIIRANNGTDAYNEGKRLIDKYGTELYELKSLDMSLVEAVARTNTAARSLILYNGVTEKDLISYITDSFVSSKVGESVKWVNGFEIKVATENGNCGRANGILEFTAADCNFSFRVAINNRPILFARPELSSSDTNEDFWGDDLWDDELADEFEDDFDDDFSNEFEDDFTDDFSDDFSDSFKDFSDEMFEDTQENEDDIIFDGSSDKTSSEKNDVSADEENTFSWLWIVIGGTAVLLIVGTVFILILLKQKKKNKE